LVVRSPHAGTNGKFTASEVPMNVYLKCLLLFSLCSIAYGGDLYEIEKRRLFSPTPAERAAEARGEIYIYDGLRDLDIDQAMDREFERIENLMFIRTKKTDQRGEVLKNPETGTDIVEDDGC
jgi:hypothetical protein